MCSNTFISVVAKNGDSLGSGPLPLGWCVKQVA